MQREDRYIVIKRKEAARHLSDAEQQQLTELCEKVHRGRTERDGKAGLACVVVERDWPEYEPVWAMLQQRVNSEGQQAD